MGEVLPYAAQKTSLSIVHAAYGIVEMSKPSLFWSSADVGVYLKVLTVKVLGEYRV